MTQPLQVPVKGGDPLNFARQKDFGEWLETEHEVWRWIWETDAPGSSISPDEFHSMRNSINHGRQVVANEEVAGVQQWINNAYNPTSPALFASQSLIGVQALKTMKDLGVGEARTMLKIVWQGMDFRQILTPVDIRGMLLAAQPSTLEHLASSGMLEAERKNFRTALTQMANKLDQNEQSNRDQDARRIKTVRNAISLLRKGVTRRGNAITKSMAEQTSEAIHGCEEVVF